MAPDQAVCRLDSGPVVIPVPADEVGDALIDAGGGFVVEIGDQVVDVSIGIGHVARLQGQQIFFGLQTKALFQGFDVLD